MCGYCYHFPFEITHTPLDLNPHTTAHLSFLLGARGMEEAGNQLLRERESPLLKAPSRSVSRGSSSSGLAAFSLSVPDMAGIGRGEGSPAAILSQLHVVNIRSCEMCASVWAMTSPVLKTCSTGQLWRSWYRRKALVTQVSRHRVKSCVFIRECSSTL